MANRDTQSQKLSSVTVTEPQSLSQVDTVLSIQGLSVSYRPAEPVIGPISLEVMRGEFVSIVGPSGCGKTTLLNCIGGHLAPTVGAVSIDKIVVDRPMPQIGTVFQSYTLFPWLTVRENICFGLKQKGMPAGEQAEIAKRFIAEVGLTGFESHYPKQLSGGMQQRVALARALANDPKILLLDEPFGALDNQTRALMQELLLSIWELHKKTVLFVTHDIDEAIFMANRCAVFSARPGRIKNELRIDLPYPRHYTVKTTPRFSELKAQVTEDIRVETLRAVQMER
jgi:ABC-type nitrate/sulfonate/bicarbonate transport system ATPase subunit